MADVYHIQQGTRPQGGPSVPPQHPQQPMPQNGRQQPMIFQQRPVDPRISQQMPQHQQQHRPMPQQASGIPQQGPYSSDYGSPQPQASYPVFANSNQAPRHQDSIIPDEFGRFIEVSDLTAATFTEDMYHQYLSSPIAVRFEKIEPRANKYDSTGEKIPSSWVNCIRRLLPKFDAVQADEEMQRLSRNDAKKGITLLKKTQSLGPNAQNQVTKAERDLSAAVQDPRFHVILKQLDWTEKPLVVQHGKGSKHRASKVKERASITAYFSRCPKPNQVPSALYRQLEIEKFQGQAQADQRNRQREILAHREHDERAREKRKHEVWMAEQRVRQEEARRRRVQEERMMFNDQAGNRGQQQQQQRPMPGQAMHPSQMPQNRHGQHMPPGTGMQMPPHQQTRPPMSHQQAPIPQQHAQFLQNNGQYQQGQPQNNRQMPPPHLQHQQQHLQQHQQQHQQHHQQHHHQQQGPFGHGANGRHTPNGNRPIIVTTKHSSKAPRHHHSRPTSSTPSTTSHSSATWDSDSEPSSPSTQPSSLASGSPTMSKPATYTYLHPATTRPHNKPSSRVSRTTYIVSTPASSSARSRHRPPRLRRGETAYIQTGSDRRIHVPSSAPLPRHSSPAVDVVVNQVRKAYLAGHADRDKLLLHSEASGRARTYNHHRSRSPLARSDTRSSSAKVYQDRAVLPLAGFRRVSASEVGRELSRERARGEYAAPRVVRVAEHGRREQQQRDLEDRFARVRIDDDMEEEEDEEEVDHRQQQQQRRRRESLAWAKDEHEEILRGIGEGAGRRASPERNPFISVRFDPRSQI